MRCSVSLDPCVPPPAHVARDAASLPLHSPAHRIGSRHFHRYHHVRGAKAAAPSPADTCGKHFANDNSGKLADRPTDGGPPSGAAKGKVVVAKLAAGGPASRFGAASLLGAAALAGALAAPPGSGIPTPGPAAPASVQAGVAPLSVGPFMPGSPGGSPLPLSAPRHTIPGRAGWVAPLCIRSRHAKTVRANGNPNTGAFQHGIAGRLRSLHPGRKHPAACG